MVNWLIIGVIASLVVAGTGGGIIAWLAGKKAGADEAYRSALESIVAGGGASSGGFLTSLLTGSTMWLIVAIVVIFLLIMFLFRKRR